MDSEESWRKAIEQTWVVRFPKQRLATFGSTNIAYYVVTEPVYQEIDPANREGVVRTGRVVAERPTVVTPTYALNLSGFSAEAYEYLRHEAAMSGPNAPGVLYQYRNEAGKMEIVGGVPREIAHRIGADLDRKKDDLSVVMVGVDELWDVALLKFVYEFTSSSLSGNVQELESRGMLDPQADFGGLPARGGRPDRRAVPRGRTGRQPGRPQAGARPLGRVRDVPGPFFRLVPQSVLAGR